MPVGVVLTKKWNISLDHTVQIREEIFTLVCSLMIPVQNLPMITQEVKPTKVSQEKAYLTQVIQLLAWIASHVSLYKKSMKTMETRTKTMPTLKSRRLVNNCTKPQENANRNLVLTILTSRHATICRELRSSEVTEL